MLAVCVLCRPGSVCVDCILPYICSRGTASSPSSVLASEPHFVLPTPPPPNLLGCLLLLTLPWISYKLILIRKLKYISLYILQSSHETLTSLCASENFSACLFICFALSGKDFHTLKPASCSKEQCSYYRGHYNNLCSARSRS